MPGTCLEACQPRWLIAPYDWTNQLVAVVVAEYELRQLLLSAVQCGLDRGRRGSHTPIGEQEGIFEQQLQMAQELRRPVSVGGLHLPQHLCVDSTADPSCSCIGMWNAGQLCQLALLALTSIPLAPKGCGCPKAWPAALQVHCVQHFGKLQQLLQKHGPFPAGVQAPLQASVYAWLPCLASLLTASQICLALGGCSTESLIHAGLVLHSWAGSADMTQMLANIEGVHFSISGHLTALKRVKAEAMLQQVCLEDPCLAAAGLDAACVRAGPGAGVQVPLDRLLLETDAPDGLPHGDFFQGRLHPLQAGGERLLGAPWHATLPRAFTHSNAGLW